MEKVLIISGHTDLKKSVANKKILEEIAQRMPDVSITYLDELYSDFKIDIKEEQKKLINSDIIVLQYPIFWYGMPSLLQKWMEDVFEHGFSHGSTGDKLKNKKLIVSFTTGAPEELYHRNSIMGYNIEEFLSHIIATCNLCGMKFCGYVYTGGVSYQMRENPEMLEQIEKKAETHAQKLLEKIKEAEKEES